MNELYRQYKTDEVAMCYDDDDTQTNPREIPIGSPARHKIEDEKELQYYIQVTTEVFCPYHKKWEWKGEAIHWKEDGGR